MTASTIFADSEDLKMSKMVEIEQINAIILIKVDRMV
jgi:hypothetical protein